MRSVFCGGVYVAKNTSEHDEQLHQQRRPPEDPDIEPGHPPQHRHVGKLHQGHGHRDDQRQGEGDGRQGNGHGQLR